MADPIKIDGLSQFVRNLKTLDRELPKALRVAFNQAADIVVQDARAKVPSKSGRGKSTVRAQSTQTASRVSEGGKRAPYMPWLDFGGKGKRPGRPAARPFRKEGRYIYDTYYRNRPRYVELLEDALLNAARSAGVEVD